MEHKLLMNIPLQLYLTMLSSVVMAHQEEDQFCPPGWITYSAEPREGAEGF